MSCFVILAKVPEALPFMVFITVLDPMAFEEGRFIKALLRAMTVKSATGHTKTNFLGQTKW